MNKENLIKLVNRCIKKILKKLGWLIGWLDCPYCGNFVKYKFEKIWIVDPEEPPLFGYYYCPDCLVRSDIRPSYLTEMVIKKLGYTDFDDYYKTVLKGLKENK